MTSVELQNIQGDIIPGFPKKAEVFFFFRIEDAGRFRPLLSRLVPLISTGRDVSASREAIRRHREAEAEAHHNHHHRHRATTLKPVAFTNIAFSAGGSRSFLAHTAPQVSDPTVDGAELLGARMTGRWKSGAPLAERPLRDDPELGGDKQRNNRFEFAPGGSQEACPFAAHVRKMNPRGDIDLQTGIQPHRVARRGIPYGPEVTGAELESRRTERERGLLFVCYQSSLASGFQFLQKAWANPAGFPPGKPEQPGQDPLIGQVADEDNVGARAMTGADPGDTARSLDLGARKWVVPRGGQYFFSPSLPVLRDVLAQAFSIQGGEGELRGGGG